MAKEKKEKEAGDGLAAEEPRTPSRGSSAHPRAQVADRAGQVVGRPHRVRRGDAAVARRRRPLVRRAPARPRRRDRRATRRLGRGGGGVVATSRRASSRSCAGASRSAVSRARGSRQADGRRARVSSDASSSVTVGPRRGGGDVAAAQTRPAPAPGGRRGRPRRRRRTRERRTSAHATTAARSSGSRRSRPQACPWAPDRPGAWRLRGMATADEERGRGVGALVLRCGGRSRARARRERSSGATRAIGALVFYEPRGLRGRGRALRRLRASDRTSRCSSTSKVIAVADATLVVVLDGAPEQALRCLSALAELAPEPDHEVVIVDDASVGLESLLARVEGDVEIVRLPHRSGFAAAVAAALERIASPVAVLLRGAPELAPGALAPLVRALDDPGVAGATAVADPGRARAAGRGARPGRAHRRTSRPTRPRRARTRRAGGGGARGRPRAPRPRRGGADERRAAAGQARRRPAPCRRARRSSCRSSSRRSTRRPSACAACVAAHPQHDGRRARDRRRRQRRAAAGLHRAGQQRACAPRAAPTASS